MCRCRRSSASMDEVAGALTGLFFIFMVLVLFCLMVAA